MLTWPRLQKKIRFIQQDAENGSGVACLAMVLKYYGQTAGIARLQKDFAPGRDGITPGQLCVLADKHGLHATAYVSSAIPDRMPGETIILGWDLTNWVVLDTMARNDITIVHSIYGRQNLSHMDVSNRFSGIYVLLSRGPSFKQQSGRDRSEALAFIADIGGKIKCFRLAIGAGTLTILLQIVSLVSPFLLRWLFDHALLHANHAVLTPLAFVLASVIAVTLLCTGLRSLTLLHLKARYDVTLMDDLLDRLLNLSYPVLQGYSRGDLIARVAGFNSVRHIVTDYGLSTAIDGIFVITYLLWLIHISGVIATAVMIVAGLQLFVLLLTQGRQEFFAQQIYRASRDQVTTLIETLCGIEFLKATGSEDVVRHKWHSLLTEEATIKNQHSSLQLAIQFVAAFCAVGGPLLALWLGAKGVLDGRLSLGAMISAVTVSGIVFAPLGSCFSAVSQLFAVRSHLERLDTVLASPPTDCSSLVAIDNLKGSIEIDDVSFAYPGTSIPCITKVSLFADIGETIALVGRTGCGKSTLASLILGINSATSGTIQIDGNSLDGSIHGDYRRLTGVVLQHTVILRGSILDNIRFGSANVTLDDVIASCKLAMIHDEILSLPLGYYTFLTEGGTGLSGGQRQKLAIARAIVRRPKLLVLDEATSHLDTFTEQRIVTALRELECTKIVIAHRLSMVETADRIYVMDKGSIVQEGTFANLSRKPGPFSELFRLSVLHQDEGPVYGNA